MLEVSEHFEYYNRDHLARFKMVGDWETYFESPVNEDRILFYDNEDCTCVQMELNRGEGDQYHCHIKSSYYIGLDRLPKMGLDVYLAPKVNTDGCKLDYTKMLIEALVEPENFDHLDGLIQVKFDNKWISIKRSEEPLLTPFLLVQFLVIVKSLVKKGLKKSYYIRTENLNGRIKGKILVGSQVKTNMLKNRILDNFCQFQEFGTDSEANQFLKFGLFKVSKYLETINSDSVIYKTLKELLDYNLAGFPRVSDKTFGQCKYKEVNSFYKNYNKAIEVGNQILRMEDYNIARERQTEALVAHPPFWIDMSKLFELFIYKRLKSKFPGKGAVLYHKKYNRQEPDFVLNTQSGIKAVVDCKYKPRYKNGNPSIEDSRQLSGYTRLNKIYEELDIRQNEVIPAYIIYPANLDKSEVISTDSSEDLDDFQDDNKLGERIPGVLNDNKCRLSKSYKLIYMEEINLPFIGVAK